MILLGNISLRKYNTFRLDYRAAHLVKVRSEKEARQLFDGTFHLRKPFLIAGGGSNLLFRSNFAGTVILPEISGIRVSGGENGKVIISAGAGVDWDKLVGWCVERNYSGIENLSLIPGKVGAVPIQNIGAYGCEVKDTILKVRCISTSDGSVKYFSNEECRFGYRESIFKKDLKGRYLVTRVYFILNTLLKLNVEYGSLKGEIEKLGKPTLQNIRQAVINIRRSKLPDPADIGNAGSFFKNPVVEKTTGENLREKYPEMPFYQDKQGFVKLAAGWMIDQCNWKGKRVGEAGVHDRQALVLVNHGNASGDDIFELSEQIKASVYEKFGITLEREVEVI
jgi:UDP-N-acetylmuramate dehydrogenase